MLAMFLSQPRDGAITFAEPGQLPAWAWSDAFLTVMITLWAATALALLIRLGVWWWRRRLAQTMN